MNTMMIDRATVQQAIDALNSSAKTMLSLYGGWRCETTIKKANETATALSEAIEEDEKTTAGHMGRAKLAALLEQGFSVNGVAIARERENGSVERGAVTYGGMVLWWHPEQERVIAPNVRSVAQQTLDALEKFGHGESSGISMTVLVHNLREALAAAKPRESDQYSHLPAGPTKALHQARAALLGPVADGFAHRCAVAAIDAALAEPKNQLDDINVADMAAPQPAQDATIIALHEALAEPVASTAKGEIMGAAYEFRDAHISGSSNLKRSAHAALEAAVDAALNLAPQQAPDALHLAAMDLARKQADRINELEAEVARLTETLSNPTLTGINIGKGSELCGCPIKNPPAHPKT